jgi:hypothetical protein
MGGLSYPVGSWRFYLYGILTTATLLAIVIWKLIGG